MDTYQKHQNKVLEIIKEYFTPKDIYDLTRADKYTNYGQLELIETQTASGDNIVDFTDIKEMFTMCIFRCFTSSKYS